MMTRRDDLRKRDCTSSELPRLNKDIQKRICEHKRQKWRDFVENMDHKTDIIKLWRTIKGIDGRAKRTAENEVISFNGISFTSSKQLAAKLNKQFNTSKLGRHSSSREMIGNEGDQDQEETNGDGGDFHCVHSYESNQEL